MPTSYPGALDNMPNPGAATLRNAPGFELDVLVSNLGDAVEQLETKLGTGVSQAAANQVLRGTGVGVTSFGQVATAMIAANAVTQIWQNTLAGSTTLAPWATLGTVPITSSGGNLILFVSVIITHTPINLAYLGFNLDAATDFQIAVNYTGPNFQTVSALVFIGAAAAGAHNVNIRWGSTAGGTLAAGSGSQAMVLELKR